ncbi:hypothetical protein F5Y16DRAFT_278922 [Xylariaceae sp. FL0255]|nr:hypothetical protein F5Y16DRAFT_278922 [Xylariaceae sp. FL0255]
MSPHLGAMVTDRGAAGRATGPLIDLGLDCFNMADYYGKQELVLGKFQAIFLSLEVTVFTWWRPPEDDNKSFEAAEQAVDRALQIMEQGQSTLMQCHVWDYSDDAYMQGQGKIEHTSLTKIDAAHLELLVGSGFEMATKQASRLELDRHLVRGRLTSVCAKHNPDSLAYDTLLGGLLCEKRLDDLECGELELKSPQNIFASFVQQVDGGSFKAFCRFCR